MHSNRDSLFVLVCLHAKSLQSCPTLCDPIDCSSPGSSVHGVLVSMGFSRQEYWSGVPFPSPGDLPDPGIEPGSPALQLNSLLSEPLRKPMLYSSTLLFIHSVYSSLHPPGNTGDTGSISGSGRSPWQSGFTLDFYRKK